MGATGSSLTAEGVSEGADLTGKVALVTGTTSGIGQETARVLCSRGAHVLMACRDVSRAEMVAKEIRESIAHADVDVLELDLRSLASVRKCAEAFLKTGLPLHLLILNAGVMANPRELTADGFESQLGTNHVGHFLLTDLLLERLKSSAPSRIISVSSSAHRMGHFDFDDMNLERSYSAWGAYGRSKLANILFASELNRRLEGTGVVAVSLHPGVIKTELWRHLGVMFRVVIGFFASPFTKSVPQGAATTLYCATSKDIVGGKFYMNCHEEAPANAEATDDAVAKRLWEWTVNAVSLPPPSAAAASPESAASSGSP